MKLIEALKNTKTIEKRIEKNCELIRQYAAWVSVETPAFETEERQRQEVASLVQANLDLEKEFLRLKVAIETTNLATRVAIGAQEYSIAELNVLRGNRKTGLKGSGQFRLGTYSALSGQLAAQRMQQIFSKGIDAANPPRVITAYAEADKNKALREWDELLSQIDGRLEVVNAETELLGYDPAAPAAKAA